MLNPDGDARWEGFDGFQVDAGVRIQGNGGRIDEGANDHRAIVLAQVPRGVRCEQAAVPVFESAPLNAASATDEFDTLILRAGHDKSWGAQRDPVYTVYTAISSRATCRSR